MVFFEIIKRVVHRLFAYKAKTPRKNRKPLVYTTLGEKNACFSRTKKILTSKGGQDS